MADAAEFDEFYLHSRDRLALQLAALTGDPAEALDHVQEAFVKAWTRWDRVSGLDDPEGWVRRVAYHHAVSRWRRARRTVLRPDPPAGQMELEPDQRELIDALRALGSSEREAIVLHHLAGYSVAEVAHRMAAPEGTVKSWLSRGRTRLGAQLREQARSAVTADAREEHHEP